MVKSLFAYTMAAVLLVGLISCRTPTDSGLMTGPPTNADGFDEGAIREQELTGLDLAGSMVQRGTLHLQCADTPEIGHLVGVIWIQLRLLVLLSQLEMLWLQE